MSQDQDLDLSYLNQRADEGFDAPEFQGPDAGLRRIQHMNPHNFRRGTQIHEGGFLIQLSTPDAYPEFGKKESVKLGDNQADCYTAKSFRAAVLGFTDRYWTLHGISPADGKYRSIIVDQYVDPAGPDMPEGWKCDGRCTLFVVPQSDPMGRTWALTVKGKESVAAVAAINSTIKGELNRLRRELKLNASVPLNMFDIWVDITVAPPVLSGKPGAQSEVAPVMIEPVPAIDLRSRLVGRDNAIKFLDLAREARLMIDQGKFAPAANSPTRSALPASAPAAQISAPASAPAEPQALPF
jgi:hypothetical protein